MSERKVKAVRYTGPLGRVLVNDKPLSPGAIVTEPPDVVAEFCTRGDFEPVYEEEEEPELEGAAKSKRGRKQE